MRLFVAFTLPESVRRELFRLLDEQRDRLPPARWVAAENVHLSLLFLGERAEAELDQIARTLGPIFAQHPILRLQVAEAGAFPGRTGRVIWQGVDDDLDLTSLQSAIAAAVEPSQPTHRHYHPHLTLARCRRPWVREAIEQLRRATSPLVGEKLELTRGELFHSQLGLRGATYRSVASFPLGAGSCVSGRAEPVALR